MKKQSQYKKAVREMHNIKPTTLMEDTDIEGFKLFVQSLEAQIDPSEYEDMAVTMKRLAENTL